MDKVKKILGVFLLILTGAFLFERSRRKSAEAIADNKEMLDKLNEGNKEMAKNNGQLEAEEEKRNEIRKEADDRKSDDSSDVADFLRKR